MQKVVIPRAGGYERLHLAEAPTPSCGPDDVLINVRAIGVNYADCVVRMGLYASAKEYVGWPITPGFEVAGEVGQVGQHVSGFELGQRVIGLMRFGGYASQVSVPSSQVFRVPEELNWEQAGAFSVAALTAWYALCEQGGLSEPSNEEALNARTKTVLIHSAAGGVGSAAIQIARICGARVIGVVGASHKVAHASQVGADIVIDKSSQKLWQEVERCCPEGVDVVLDPNGQETLVQSYKHLRPTGRLVIYGFQTMLSKGRSKPNWFKLLWGLLRTPRFSPLLMTNDNKSVLAFNLSYLFEEQATLGRAMSRLLAWADQGRLKVFAVQSFPLSHVADAQRALESGTTRGKLVLVPDAP